MGEDTEEGLQDLVDQVLGLTPVRRRLHHHHCEHRYGDYAPWGYYGPDGSYRP